MEAETGRANDSLDVLAAPPGSWARFLARAQHPWCAHSVLPAMAVETARPFPQLVRCLIRDPRFLLYCCIGVFPMIFLPGLSGQFVAVADTEDAAQALRPRAEACLQVAGIALGRQPQQPCSHPGCWFRRRSPQPLFTLTHSLLPPHINLVCACFRYCPAQGSRQSAQSCPCSGAWILCAVCALGACGA